MFYKARQKRRKPHTETCIRLIECTKCKPTPIADYKAIRDTFQGNKVSERQKVEVGEIHLIMNK